MRIKDCGLKASAEDGVNDGQLILHPSSWNFMRGTDIGTGILNLKPSQIHATEHE